MLDEANICGAEGGGVQYQRDDTGSGPLSFCSRDRARLGMGAILPSLFDRTLQACQHLSDTTAELRRTSVIKAM